MKLFYRHLPAAQPSSHAPLFILHGLFGQSDNWQTLAKAFAQERDVYVVDQRNHGLSPHSADWNYALMSRDFINLVHHLQVDSPYLLGHSMGGKTAMQVAFDEPQLLKGLLVADIAPRLYQHHHDTILNGLQALDFDKIKSRKEAEEELNKYIPDAGTRQFLLKNLYWVDEQSTRLNWRFNLPVIASKIDEVIQAVPHQQNCTCALPTLFLRGEHSDYILPQDEVGIKSLFPSATIETIRQAGHWLHAEQPKLFLERVQSFMTQKENK